MLISCNLVLIHHLNVSCLFDLSLKVLPSDQIRDVIIIVIVLLVITTAFLLHGLVTLGELSERSKGVGAELVEDTGYEFSKFLVFTVTVDSEGIGWDGGVNCRWQGSVEAS
jgi:ABC-type uncharacterized transport system permease subunit